ncbi:hypothetical protein [Pantoea eucrina]|uniref:Uncharacterized protein n=1 Tax=Pantoea eucrina TaxID=472693 RepID=A0ABS1Z4P1_9GAMM|nr:hypothetical protein [Pantoea eucrina]AIX50049.1 hypothetical protein PSNIH1_07280 [Pantoea sp. PSNIH1]MBM0747367.1 hypothetical protein [Pantoea eucrina]PPS57810.1 hypothetical protein CRX72_07000 [Pantoea sp. BRM17]UBB13523.1 hypothetical protein LAC65_01375 [Pantoea eucrina]
MKGLQAGSKALPAAANFFLFPGIFYGGGLWWFALFFFLKFFMAEGFVKKLQRTPDQIKKEMKGLQAMVEGAIRSAGRRATARASRQDAGESAG